MDLDGAYIATKFYSSVKLEKPEDKTFETIEYFKFQALLFKYFDANVIEKICEKICERKSILIDFSKCVAYHIKDKNIRFKKEFYKTMTTSAVENFYSENGGDMSETNYIKSILGDTKDVEPIF